MTTKPGLKFSVAAIDSAKEILKALPPAPHSRQQIVDLIQEQGVGCSLTSLKTYFRRSPGKTKAKSLAASTAGPAAAYQETGPAASRPVISAGSGGPEVGTNAGPRDATSAHPQSPPDRTVGGQAGVGLAATGATARAAAKAS